MNVTDSIDSDGRRIRRLRKRAGLTQQRFAELMGRSQSWVSGIERDDIPLDSIALINTAARVLRVDPNDITGQPHLLASPEQERGRDAICAIRRVVQRWDLPPDWETDPRPVSQLGSAVAGLTGLRRRARYADLGEAVPDVLREIHAAVHVSTGTEQQRAYALLAMAYKEADTVAHNLGHDDLATLAVERFRWAAICSTSPDLIAIGDYLRVRDLWNNSLWRDALHVLEARLGDADILEPTITGSLHLRAAITAARGGDEDGAFGWIEESQRLAAELPDAPDRFEMTFTPANVDIHSVAVAVEAMDGAKALTLASGIQLPGGVPRSRRARWHLDKGRACIYHGAYDKAVPELEAAERLAPLMVRNSPHAAWAIRTLMERRGTKETVRRLAARVNLA